ncbi:MAG: terminase family protein [Alphaproteobacteria bacterium]
MAGASWFEGVDLTDIDALAAMPPDDRARLMFDWPRWARPKQLAPPGNWAGWVILAGRGAGKTRTGAEWVRAMVESGRMGRLALVAETAADCRDVLVEGESGILSVSPPWNRPVYESSKRRLTWPNGAIATLYNGTEPDQLRGPQHDGGWLDELAKYRYAQETMDMFLFGLRLGADPRYLVTTTPRPIKLIKEMVKDPYIVVTRGSSLENLSNLSPTYRRNVIDRYAGTRLGRQEIDAEILTDTPGALWTLDILDQHRVRAAPEMTRIVVAIDPAVKSGQGKSGQENADHGVVVAGIANDGRCYVLQDLSLSGSPDQVMKVAVQAYHAHRADRVIAEVNNGGDWIEAVIRKIDANVSYKAIHASRGKIVRAEPVSALYEQGRVSHVGAMPALEDQMIEYTGDRSERSPDRMDALVWAVTELMLGSKEAFTVKEDDFVVQPFRLPDHWPRAMGVSSTASGIAAVWLALDRPMNTVYLYTEHLRNSGEPSSHIRAVQARGAVRAVYVHDTSKEEALEMAALYQGHGIKFAALSKCAEADLMHVTELLTSGRLKVFSTMQKWIADYRRYREAGDFKDAPLVSISGPLVRLRDSVAQVVTQGPVVKPWSPADKMAGY